MRFSPTRSASKGQAASASAVRPATDALRSSQGAQGQIVRVAAIPSTVVS